MRVLFVCKHNRFRSKIAEAAFKKINKNKNLKVSSAGVFKGFPTENIVVKIGNKFGLKIPKKTKGLIEKEIYKVDLLIITANDVPASLFKNKVKKIIVWKIPDTSQNNIRKIEEIIRIIIKKVDKLVYQLNRRRK
ncbi:MAG: hypothetical protein AABX30_01925 [Nanoarchaeota archaeon]